MLLVADVVKFLGFSAGSGNAAPGPDLDRAGRLHPDAIARTLAAIDRQIARAVASCCQDHLPSEPSRCRAAENSEEFDALRATGVEPARDSGDDEARLSFLIWWSSLPVMPSSGRRSVIDIGGIDGAYRRWQTPERWASVKMGSVRLRERFVCSDPPTEAETKALTGN